MAVLKMSRFGKVDGAKRPKLLRQLTGLGDQKSPVSFAEGTDLKPKPKLMRQLTGPGPPEPAAAAGAAAEAMADKGAAKLAKRARAAALVPHDSCRPLV